MNNKDIIADFILERFNTWQDARDEKQSRWMEQTRVSRLQEDSADRTIDRESEKSKLKMPTTKNAITIAMDNLYRILFNADQFFSIAGRTPDDEPETLKFYLKYLLQKDNFKMKINPFLNQLCCHGTAISQVNIKVIKQKRIIQKNSLKSNPVKRFTDRFFKLSANDTPNEVVKLDEKTIVRPSFEWIDLFNFYIEPQALDIQSSTGVIVRKQLKFHVLKQMQSSGVISGVDRIFENLVRDTKEIEDGDVQAGNIDDDRRERLQKSGLIADLADGDVSLLEYWGWLDKSLLDDAGFEGDTQDGGAEVVCLIANGNTLLRLENNPLLKGERPFLSATYESVPGEFYGLGICDFAKGPQKALDATVRSRIDNKKIAINQVFAIDIDRIAVDKDGKIFPGKTFFTRGDPRNIVQQMAIQDVTNGSYLEAQEFERYIHEGTGISPISGGLASPKAQTATEATIQNNQASIRLLKIALELEELIIKPTLQLFYDISLQFFNEDEIIKTTGATPEDISNLKKITIAEIIGDYDFQPQGVLSILAESKFIKIMDFLTRTANQFDVQATNRPLLLKKAYQTLGFNDADQVFGRDNKVGLDMLERSKGAKGVGSPPASGQGPGTQLTGDQASQQGGQLG